MREITICKTLKEIRVADFDLIDAKTYTFTDVWNKETTEKTMLKIAYDVNNLYFLFRSYFDGVLPEKYRKKSGKVFRADCTEVFICFDGDREHYYELDISPFNKSFVASISNPDNVNIRIEMVDKDIIVTKTQICEHYYDTLYVLPFGNFSPNCIENCEILCNAYRVKIENNKRVSRVLNPTYALNHHIKDCFVKLILK